MSEDNQAINESSPRVVDANHGKRGKGSKERDANKLLASKGGRNTISVTVSCEDDTAALGTSSADDEEDDKRSFHSAKEEESLSCSASLPRRSSKNISVSEKDENILIRNNSYKSHSVLTDRTKDKALLASCSSKETPTSLKASKLSRLSSILSPSCSLTNINSASSPAIVSSSVLTSTASSYQTPKLASTSNKGINVLDANMASTSPTPSLPNTSPLHYALCPKDVSSASPKLGASHHHHTNFTSSFKSLKRSPLSRSRSGGIFSNPFKSDRDKMDHLTELLNQYSLHGIPEISSTPSIKKRSQILASMFKSKHHQSTESDVDIDDPNVVLRNKSRTPSTSSSSGFNTLSTTTTNQSTLSATDGRYLASTSSLRRKSYQPPVTKSQQSMQQAFQSQRPGSYHEQSILSKGNISSKCSTSISIDEVDVINIDPDDEDLFIEDHWNVIIKDVETLNNKHSVSQMDAFWELLTTEINYIKRLRVIHNLFHVCLSNLQKEGLLIDIESEKIFGNIEEVYESNIYFWMNHLLPVLKESRSTGRKLDPISLSSGFIKFDTIFHPYIKYCLEHVNCVSYVKSKNKENELFKTYIVWCETRKECERLRLTDLLAKPMQRLTKYSLLLKAILKKTDDPSEINIIKQMNESVETFVLGVDSALRRKHETERVTWIASRIESYDVIDMNTSEEVERTLKEYTRLDFLSKPMIDCKSNQMRSLVMEGSNIKFKDHSLSTFTSSKVDVHLILFTDLLLICKKVSTSHAHGHHHQGSKKSSKSDLTSSTTPSMDKVKVIRPPYLIDRLIIVSNNNNNNNSNSQQQNSVTTDAMSTSSSSSVTHAHSLTHGGHSFGGTSHTSSSSAKDLSSFSLIYLNEFKVASSLLSFSSIDAKVWLDAISRTQIKYTDAKKRANYLSISNLLSSPSNLSLYKSINISTDAINIVSDATEDANMARDANYIRDANMIRDANKLLLIESNNNILMQKTRSEDGKTTAPPSDNNKLNQQQQHQQLISTINYNLSSNRSSRSSLFLSHSHSGSIELLPDPYLLITNTQQQLQPTISTSSSTLGGAPFYYGSTLSVNNHPGGATMTVAPPTIAPSSTPNPWLLSATDLTTTTTTQDGGGSQSINNSNQLHSNFKARSFELGDLRNPSLTVDGGEESFCRSHSMETRGSPVHVLVTSPRPERRAFLLKGSGSSPYSSCDKYESSTSLYVPGIISASNSRKSSFGTDASGPPSGRLTAIPMMTTTTTSTSSGSGCGLHQQQQITKSASFGVQTVDASKLASKPIMKSIQTQTLPQRTVNVISSKCAATNTMTIVHSVTGTSSGQQEEKQQPQQHKQVVTKTVSHPTAPLPRSYSVLGSSSGVIRKVTPPKVPPRKGVSSHQCPPPPPRPIRPISSPASMTQQQQQPLQGSASLPLHSASPNQNQRACSSATINKPPLIKTKNVPTIPPRGESFCCQVSSSESQQQRPTSSSATDAKRTTLPQTSSCSGHEQGGSGHDHDCPSSGVSCNSSSSNNCKLS